MKIKKGDEVKVIKGKDKGKVAKVEKVFAKLNTVMVEGLNQYKRHVKARAQNQKSEIVTISKPLPVTNIVLICPKCHNPARVGYKITGDQKQRICKKCEQAI